MYVLPLHRPPASFPTLLIIIANTFKPAHSNAFSRLFSPRAASTAIRPVPSHAQITVECLDAWISAGTRSGPCTHLRVTEPRIDVTWTWADGSGPLHAAARAEHAAEQPKDPGRSGAMNAQAGALKQYREHGELLYSMRDWAASMWHLVTNSNDAPEGAELSKRDKLLGTSPPGAPPTFDSMPVEPQLAFHTLSDPVLRTQPELLRGSAPASANTSPTSPARSTSWSSPRPRTWMLFRGGRGFLRTDEEPDIDQ
ncbi:hypothetical protein PUNSTDRAFT_113976 [Punctularia strigosozonata HHB-11173 SS5]|uniref:uncharacterized protein n=1 Tax=Punctularia strigosozonata (strain HHB-11173) TaxID=741275 RepID=UPI0004416E30|nr:uncharacterized protein PUNSTDRAFT_113976 [Punctularia strigosozonata HHB-11173 SS5]EIN08455.1 hypothetical protein PUNSTDRAFT_113976 [Punctularia strigosozonata HHB-11173 SS5]